MQDCSQEVAEFIASLRNIAGMTQSEFAKAIGVSRSYVSAVENQDRIPNLNFLLGVRQRFGVSIDALFDGLKKI